ncbi:polysaccharide export outer membrane protein [Polaromonas sp. CG_9.5]|uniref:polysaccharide biosynthesis/export family protein n=1 Tax=Polaromonas sp. CG_9.5 TaxID=3071705 RepID=UPI002DFB6B46|nr:polysaccharide export outer membrane protein [Polaromonas sp. CG_9.5]
MFQKSNLTPMLARSHWAVMALAVVSVGGCAFAPGLSIGKGVQKTSQSVNSSVSTSQAVQQGDPAPPGALLAITPDLIIRQRALQKSALGTDVKALFGKGMDYGIGPSDVIDIVVWNHPELGAATTGYKVNPEGLIQFPLLGTFKIAGLTEIQARDQLTRRLAKFFNDPQINLRVKDYRAGRVYIDGEVRNPGQQAINDIPMTLPEAISRAGGLTLTADGALVEITRKSVTTVVNMPQLTMLGVNPSKIMLVAGDLVRVGSREENKVYVLGEVTRPIALPLRNGRMTLNEALGESLGVNALSGDPRQIYIVRTRSGDGAMVAGEGREVSPITPEIYHLDASSPTAYALAEGFDLKSRDVVFVDPVPLVLWNRVISLVLPSAQAVTVTRAVTN